MPRARLLNGWGKGDADLVERISNGAEVPAEVHEPGCHRPHEKQSADGSRDQETPEHRERFWLVASLSQPPAVRAGTGLLGGGSRNLEPGHHDCEARFARLAWLAGVAQ